MMKENIVDNIIDLYVDDEKGKELVERYVYGDGTDYIIANEESWSNYMMDNSTLALQTGFYLNPIGENLKEGETKEISIETAIILQDTMAEHSGYMLLYGSNKDVGGYQIKGTVSKDIYGNVTYDMTYTFNDIMDPNFKYREDMMGYGVLKILQMCGMNVTLENYNIQIIWSDKTIIYANGYEADGWLSDMRTVDTREEIEFWDNQLLILPWSRRNEKESIESTIRFYQSLQEYIDGHPEYYDCS